ncbi:hypothetical protein CGCF415_v012578 [Colletotrichum fructicola]|nr:hypothetical protein CGCF415_v012578 [Colletotrichum fructicola]KAF4928757.1 hypothetical protein CGCF245_v012537 [Colletotrichum fructicola]
MNSLDFENDRDSVYFEDWNDLVQVSLGGAPFSRTKLWNEMMPQLSRQNPALRHAAISIGAMSRALSQKGNYVVARNFNNIADLLQSQHYQSAIVHYCQALRLQAHADFQTASIQEAVLLSILFVSFEALRGNRHSALQHVRYGFVLLQELLMSEDADARIWNLAPDPRQLITEVLDLYNHLDVQSRTVLAGNVKTSRSPAYELIRGLKARGHTIETYNMQIQRYTDPGEGRKNMPEIFYDAEQAYTWWQVCQRRIAKLGPLLLSVIDDLKLDEITDEKGIDELLVIMQDRPELLAYCEKSMGHLQQWRASFEPLYNRTLSDSSISRREYLKILHLRMHYLIMFIYSFFPKYADEATISSMTPYCREINEVIEILLREQEKDIKSPANLFSMEFGIAWQLTIVAMTCRDPLCDLRLEACGQCRRAKITCHGYRDPNALQVRDESRSVERKVVTQRDGVIPGLQSQPTGLELGWDTRARYAFFSTYIGGFTRSMGEVTHHYRTATACDHLSASVEAASLAYMGTQLGSAHLLALANSSYVKAIQRLSRSLNDLSSEGAEEALQSVLLLDMYEKMVHRDPQNSQAWKSHSQGGLTLLHSRATTILSSPTGRQVAARLVTAVIVTCATVGINTSKELASVRRNIGYHVNSPKWSFLGILNRVSNLHFDFKAGRISERNFIIRAKSLDDQLVTLEATVPSTWRPLLIPVTGGNPHVLGTYYHLYPDHYTTQVTNALRTMRLILYIIVKRYTADGSYTQDSAFKKTIRDIAHHICASVPQFTLPRVCETNTLPFSPVQQLQCRTFLAPLYLVHQVSEDDSVKQWVKNCLANMWQSGGLKTAKDIAEVMDTEPNLDYWSVFATTGSYAFAA